MSCIFAVLFTIIIMLIIIFLTLFNKPARVLVPSSKLYKILMQAFAYSPTLLSNFKTYENIIRRTSMHASEITIETCLIIGIQLT